MATKDKHIPQRTCIACREVKDKRLLVRLVRKSDGWVEPDASAGKEGRGAYICPQKSCWDVALKKNRLEHALRTKLSHDNRNVLSEYGSKMVEEN
ncbi:MAG: YlxR family protein [Dehalococcoidia bacterium]|nr:YlxR family protein [Dehalococcoidia bacterium]